MSATTLQPVLDPKELLSTGEYYVTHIEVKDESSKQCYLLVSTEYLYKIDPVSKKKLWFLPNTFIRDISESEGGVKILYQEFEKKQGSKVKRSVKESNFKRSEFFTQDENQLRLVSIALEGLLRRAWQAIFEGSIIQSPDVYQGHFFVFKLDKKSKLHYRCIVLTSNRLFLTTPSETSNNFVVKWAVGYESIEMVSGFNQYPNVLSIHFAENAFPVAGIRNRPVRMKIAFQALDSQIRQKIVHDLRRAYNMWTESDLLNNEVKLNKKKSLKSVMKT